MAGEPESLDTDESLARRRHRHGFDRVIMLSDGVFAIAITLLAFNFQIPEGASVRSGDLWSALAPQLDAYALSFLVISIYWLAHRRFMAMIVTADAPVTVLNLVMLALVAILPAATRLAHMPGPMAEHMMIYGGLVVAIGVSLAALWGYAALAVDLVSPEVSRPERWFLFALILITPPLFLALTALPGNPGPGTIPAMLIALFLIGWRMRLWVLARLADWAGAKKKAAPDGAAS
jgi:uncharacterized membrane protein